MVSKALIASLVGAFVGFGLGVLVPGMLQVDSLRGAWAGAKDAPGTQLKEARERAKAAYDSLQFIENAESASREKERGCLLLSYALLKTSDRDSERAVMFRTLVSSAVQLDPAGAIEILKSEIEARSSSVHPTFAELTVVECMWSDPIGAQSLVKTALERGVFSSETAKSLEEMIQSSASRGSRE